MSGPKTTQVYLVGAGPGDPGLLTIRGAEILGRADLVVCDGLVDPRVLRFAREGTPVVFVGQRGRGRTVAQEPVNRLLVDSAREGKTVVRLKGGDPYVFGRGGEEASELHDSGVPFEVVPGVSAFGSVPAYAGIPLVHEGVAPAVCVVSGHEDPTKPSAQVDWSAVAAMPGTKVILMGVERLGAILGDLAAAGLSAGTPAAIVRWGTTGEQSAVVGTVADLAERATRAGLRSPAAVVLGEVVNLRASLNCFEARPLFGKRVVVTRSRAQAAGLSSRLADEGADVVEIPTIRTAPPSDPAAADEALGRIGEFDWAIFTSSNGVDAFFERMFATHPDIRRLGQLKLAAVGEATASRLRDFNLRVDLTPVTFSGREIAAALARHTTIADFRILLPRAEVGAPGLREDLEALGAIVDDVPFYRTLAETGDTGGELERLQAEGADWLTFTSGSTANHFAQRLDLSKLLAAHPGMRVASIGPETSKALRTLGVEPAMEADPHTTDGLVRALIKSARR